MKEDDMDRALLNTLNIINEPLGLFMDAHLRKVKVKRLSIQTKELMVAHLIIALINGGK